MHGKPCFESFRLPLERGQSHFGLEDWAVLLTCLLHVLLLVSVLFQERDSHLATCPISRVHLSGNRVTLSGAS